MTKKTKAQCPICESAQEFELNSDLEIYSSMGEPSFGGTITLFCLACGTEWSWFTGTIDLEEMDCDYTPDDKYDLAG